MEDLWGEPYEQILPKRATPLVRATDSRPNGLAQAMCAFYGHTWQRIGLSGEKQCTVCGINGYCPGCTPVPPNNAQPFFCTRHTRSAKEGPQS